MRKRHLGIGVTALSVLCLTWAGCGASSTRSEKEEQPAAKKAPKPTYRMIQVHGKLGGKVFAAKNSVLINPETGKPTKSVDITKKELDGGRMIAAVYRNGEIYRYFVRVMKEPVRTSHFARRGNLPVDLVQPDHFDKVNVPNDVKLYEDGKHFASADRMVLYTMEDSVWNLDKAPKKIVDIREGNTSILKSGDKERKEFRLTRLEISTNRSEFAVEKSGKVVSFHPIIEGAEKDDQFLVSLNRRTGLGTFTTGAFAARQASAEEFRTSGIGPFSLGAGKVTVSVMKFEYLGKESKPRAIDPTTNKDQTRIFVPDDKMKNIDKVELVDGGTGETTEIPMDKVTRTKGGFLVTLKKHGWKAIPVLAAGAAVGISLLVSGKDSEGKDTESELTTEVVPKKAEDDMKTIVTAVVATGETDPDVLLAAIKTSVDEESMGGGR